MYQSKLFENEQSRGGKRWYGGSRHFHYMASNSSAEAYRGAMMVHSTMTEMISNILLGKAVGTKQTLYDSKTDSSVVEGRTSSRDSFQMCTDCPPRLLPFHVKPRPRLVCTNVSALPGNAPMGEVWNMELCPEWCLATTPVGQAQTGSGPVDVRSCPLNVPQP